MLKEKIDNELTEKIIGCFYTVYNTLGYGFLERVYEKAMVRELTDNGILVEAQKPIKVYYKGDIVGDYFADLFVEDKVIIELKSTVSILPEHEAQLFNYMRATDMPMGLLLNFGAKPMIKRKLWTKGR